VKDCIFLTLFAAPINGFGFSFTLIILVFGVLLIEFMICVVSR
jgi:hypothetical protein